MHQLVSANVDLSRRWWVLPIVVAAQFYSVSMLSSSTFPTIALDLHADPAQIGAVTIDLIADATLAGGGGPTQSGPESIAASAAFRSWMRHAAPIKDDHHDSGD